jgi:CheY-like chemotaxis protein
LIVDDDDSTNQLIAIILEDSRFEVKTAVDGAEALATMAAWRPDVILLDLLMPAIDGWKFRQAQVDEGYGDIPTLVMTAVGNSKQIEQDLGVPVVTKPFEIDDLLDRVRGLIESSTSAISGEPE